MIKNKNSTPSKFLSLLLIAATFATTGGAAATVFAQEAPSTVQVTISKYIDGEMATTESADSSDFPMTATWNAENIGAGTSPYTLSSPNYQEATSEMSQGASYATNENYNEVVGASCTSGAPYALVGYTSGETLSEAENATPSMTPPSFTNLTTDKYVIVWNEDCTPPVVEDDTAQVHISKFVDGAQATPTSADSADFTLNATWESTSHSSGTGQYILNESNNPTPYKTDSVEFNDGANYATSEVIDGIVVVASCTSEFGYTLAGYTTGETFAEAASATPSMTAPAFTNMMNDKYVIVWNESCDADDDDDSETPPGPIVGEVVGDNGELVVTSIETIDGSATANGSFEDGWEYRFNITVPTDETKLAMKFSDWVNSSNASSTIPAANNIRISSAQANNGNATVLITAADTYSSPTLNMVTDLNPTLPGLQIQVTVEVAIPTNTANGTYSTNYGVKSTN